MRRTFRISAISGICLAAAAFMAGPGIAQADAQQSQSTFTPHRAATVDGSTSARAVQFQVYAGQGGIGVGFGDGYGRGYGNYGNYGRGYGDFGRGYGNYGRQWDRYGMWGYGNYGNYSRYGSPYGNRYYDNRYYGNRNYGRNYSSYPAQNYSYQGSSPGYYVQSQPARQENSNPNRPVMGVRIRDAGDGARVVVVQPDSPAERAGLQVGDVITSLNGNRISGERDLLRQLDNLSVDQEANLTVRSDGRTWETSVAMTTYQEAFSQNLAGNQRSSQQQADRADRQSGELHEVGRADLEEGQSREQMQRELEALRNEVNRLRQSNQPGQPADTAPAIEAEGGADAQLDADAAVPPPPADAPEGDTAPADEPLPQT